MQVIDTPSAGSPSVAARARSGRSGRGPRATRNRKPLVLSVWEEERLGNKIKRVVCSEPWYRHCKGLIQSGAIAYKDDQAKELRRCGVYPPGGVGTAMEKCSACGHWSPASRYVRERTAEPTDDGGLHVELTDWRPICGDCHAAAMPLFDMARMASSPGSTTRIKDKDLAAHLEGSGFDRRSKRRRYLDGGAVRAEVVIDDEVYDLVVALPPVAEEGPGDGAADAEANAETEG